MTRIDIDLIPATVATLAIDTYIKDGQPGAYLFDRTGLEDDNGEWGDNIAEVTADIDEIETALEALGFTVEFHCNYRLDGQDGTLYTATRAAD